MLRGLALTPVFVVPLADLRARDRPRQSAGPSMSTTSSARSSPRSWPAGAAVGEELRVWSRTVPLRSSPLAQRGKVRACTRATSGSSRRHDRVALSTWEREAGRTRAPCFADTAWWLVRSRAWFRKTCSPSTEARRRRAGARATRRDRRGAMLCRRAAVFPASAWSRHLSGPRGRVPARHPRGEPWPWLVESSRLDPHLQPRTRRRLARREHHDRPCARVGASRRGWSADPAVSSAARPRAEA